MQIYEHSLCGHPYADLRDQLNQVLLALMETSDRVQVWQVVRMALVEVGNQMSISVRCDERCFRIQGYCGK